MAGLMDGNTAAQTKFTFKKPSCTLLTNGLIINHRRGSNHLYGACSHGGDVCIY